MHDLDRLDDVHEIIAFDSIDSTNRWAREHGAAPPAGITVVRARSQSGGRGRFGRPFFSDCERGLWVSLIVPVDTLERHFSLNRSLSLALCEAIENLDIGAQPRIKWPNDIYCNDKKLCGILLESMPGPGPAIVAGFGLNVNLTREDFPPPLRSIATSLAIESGERIALEPLLYEIVAAFIASRAADERSEHERYCARLYGRGALVGIGSATGRFRAVAPDGRLCVETNAGPAMYAGGELRFLAKEALS
jgi:BirA family biotin operon repressor/biotin-[acetyl-CoA-carboxylase] ligase